MLACKNKRKLGESCITQHMMHLWLVCGWNLCTAGHLKSENSRLVSYHRSIMFFLEAISIISEFRSKLQKLPLRRQTDITGFYNKATDFLLSSRNHVRCILSLTFSSKRNPTLGGEPEPAYASLTISLNGCCVEMLVKFSISHSAYVVPILVGFAFLSTKIQRGPISTLQGSTLVLVG